MLRPLGVYLPHLNRSRRRGSGTDDPPQVTTETEEGAGGPKIVYTLSGVSLLLAHEQGPIEYRRQVRVVYHSSQVDPKSDSIVFLKCRWVEKDAFVWSWLGVILRHSEGESRGGLRTTETAGARL